MVKNAKVYIQMMQVFILSYNFLNTYSTKRFTN